MRRPDSEDLHPGQMVVLDRGNTLAVITKRIDDDGDLTYLVVPVAGSTQEVIHYMIAAVVVNFDDLEEADDESCAS
jgi:hypothetical protein